MNSTFYEFINVKALLFMALIKQQKFNRKEETK